MTNIVLRDYQAVSVEEIRAAFRDGLAPVLFVLATGGGKTFTFSFIADSAASRGRSVCIIVHRKELLLQASASLTALGVDHGLISPFFTPKPTAKVQVASVDTLLQRLKKRAYKFDLLIFDEAHHVVAGNKWGRSFEQLGNPPMLGVTATPVRTDGKGLGEHAGGVFKAMVEGPPIAELIARGMLLNPVVYTSLEVPDLADLKVDKNGDYNAAEVVRRVDKPRITGSAVEHYGKICPGARAIVFCSSIDHAKHVAAQFNLAGYKFELLVGSPEMSDAERTSVNKRLRSGDLHGACTVDLVSEGYDLPDLVCCIMLRPTASEALFLQQVGRVMRPSLRKPACYLLDHVGNVGIFIDGGFKRKHGLPDEIRQWSLDGRKKKKAKKKDVEPDIDIVQCPKCYLAHMAAPECPGCGHVYVAKTRQIEVVDGTLTQITPEMQAQIKADQRKVQGSCRTEQELIEKLGFSPARAAHTMRSRREKDEFRTALLADLTAWKEKTGESSLRLFDVAHSDLKYMSLKPMRELRQRFDNYRRQKLGARDGDDLKFAGYLHDTLNQEEMDV